VCQRYRHGIGASIISITSIIYCYFFGKAMKIKLSDYKACYFPLERHILAAKERGADLDRAVQEFCTSHLLPLVVGYVFGNNILGGDVFGARIERLKKFYKYDAIEE